ncbi:hypothetical protein DYB32_005759 [Aphanomyces invadans]|uniref:IPT/TIG domain-containing protein n=1 Tax=Aphanomyces invadans TaxID=157072 RepID=A0A418ATM6_9STRA|nr:hypothetical protein DYB32_005759 [Aphanomyces invadans]
MFYETSQDAFQRSNMLMYWLVEPPQVASVHPVVGFASTITVVKLYGIHFIDSTEYRCRIGNMTSSVTWISPTQLNCDLTDRLDPGVYDVGLRYGFDGSSFLVPQLLQVSILPDPIVVSITPTHGSDFTNVTVMGSAFPPQAMCAFGHQLVRPSFGNATAMICTVPQLVTIPSVVVIAVAMESHTSRASALFSAEPPSTIQAVTPSTILTTWTALLQLTGSFTNSTREIECQFEITAGTTPIITAGTIVNATTAFCPSPRVPPSMDIGLSITSNGQAFSNRVVLSIVSPATLAALHPTNLVVGSNSSEVTVLGYNLPTECQCDFRLSGQAIAQTRPRWISPFKLICPVPAALSPNTYTVTLILDKHQIARNVLKMEWMAQPVVSLVHPTETTTLRDTLVHVMGTGFSPKARHACSFGRDSVPAVFYNSTLLVCLAPASAQPKVVHITVTVNDDVVVARQPFTYSGLPQVIDVFPTIVHVTTTCARVAVRGVDLLPVEHCHWVNDTSQAIVTAAQYVNRSLALCHLDKMLAFGTYDLFVAWNDQVLSRVGTVQIVPELHLESMFPSSGVTWQTQVVLFGSPFSPRETLWCNYDKIHVQAEFVNATAVRCHLEMTPAHIQSRHVVGISLTNNHIDYSNTLTFQFAPEFYVRTAIPGSATLYGDVEVYLVGYFPVQTGVFICRFGTQPMPAMVVNSSHVVCLSPPSLHVDAVSLALLWNDIVVDNVLTFQIVEPVRVQGVRPAIVPMNASTLVHIHVDLNRLRADDAFVCDVYGPAQVVNTTTILCPFLPSSLGLHTIQIWDNQRSPVGQIQVSVHNPLQVIDVQPRQVFESGGAVLTIRLAAHMAGEVESLQCRFGATRTVPAAYVTPSQFTCVAPPSKPGLLDVSFSYNEFATPATSSWDLLYIPRVTLHHLTPRTGATVTFTEVMIRGTNFRHDGHWQCLFGTSAVPALVLNGSALVCTAPISALDELVNVYVSCNGQEKSVNSMPFQYVSLPIKATMAIERLDPTNASVVVYGVGQYSRLGTYTCAVHTPKFNLTTMVPGTLVRNSSGLACVVPSNSITPNMVVDVWFEASKVLESITWSDTSGPTILSSTYSIQEPHIRLFGAGLNANLTCDFGHLSFPVEYVSPHMVQCPLPTAQTPTTILHVRVASSNAVLRTYTVTRGLLPVVHTVVPNFTGSFLLTNADTTLQVTGNRFRPLTASFCVVNATFRYPVRFVSSVVVTCTIPSSALSPGNASIAIEYDDRALYSAVLHVTTGPALNSITPLVAAYGSRIDVRGAWFLPSLWIRYDQRLVYPCNVTSASVATCPAPTLGTESAIFSVELSTNEGRQFVLYPRIELSVVRAVATIARVSPLVGFESNPTRLTVQGEHFDALLTTNSTLQCVFGDMVSEAHVVSPTEIHCLAPCQALGNVTFSLAPATMFRRTVPFTFRCLATPVLASVRPAIGGGGTLVAITASYIPYSTTLECKFDLVNVAAMYINSTTIVCRAPHHAAGRARLGVFLDPDNDLQPAWNATFDFRATPIVTATSPEYLVDNMDASMAIYGLNFDTTTTCVFAAANRTLYRVNATVESSTKVRCAVVGQKWPSRITLHVVALESIPSNTVDIKVLPGMRTDQWSMEPTSGAIQGGYNLRVMGANFPRINIACVLGTVQAPGRWVSSHEVTCKVPPATAVSVAQLSLQFGDFTVTTPLQFVYTAAAVVQSVAPSTGIANFPTLVNVTGLNFEYSHNVQCRFDRDVSAAIHLSHTLLLCQTPRRSSGTAQFQVVSGRNVLWTSAFDFVPVPSVHRSPSPLFGWAGLKLYLAGYNMMAVTHCRFGPTDNLSLAMEKTSTSVACTVPRNVDAASNTTVSIMIAGYAPIPITPVPFTYVRPMAITSVQVRSTSVVDVWGHFHDAAAKIDCCFGSRQNTSGVVVSATRLQCAFPDGDHHDDPMPFSVVWSTFHVLPAPDKLTITFPKPFTTSKLFPDRGGVQGGTLVRVYGTFPPTSLSLTCIFGLRHSPASYESATRTILCNAPPHTSSESVRLSVVADDSPIPSTLTYHYVNVPQVARLTLHWTAMGLQLRTTVRPPLPNNSTVWLRTKGGTAYLASVVNSTVVDCTLANVSNSDRLEFEISINRVDFVTVPTHLYVQPDPMQVFQLHPAFAVVNTSQQVAVVGRGFATCSQSDGTYCSCAFGNTTSRSLYISPTIVLCDAPALNVGTRVPFRLIANGSAVPMSPSMADLNYSVLFSQVVSISPLSGLTRGGMVIDVRGHDLDPRLGCWFGGKVFIPATVRNASWLQCTVPAHRNASTVSLTIVVTQDRRPLVPDVNFTYVDSPVVTHVFPQVLCGLGARSVYLTVQKAAAVLSNWSCLFETPSANWTAPGVPFVENSTIACAVPNVSASYVLVHLVLHGKEVVWTGWHIQLISPNTLVSVAPTTLSRHASVPIVVEALFDLPSSGLECHFAAANAPAYSTPAMVMSTSKLACETRQSALAGKVTLSLRLSGYEYTSNALTLATYEQPQGVDVVPASSRVDGNVTVRILGKNFLQTSDTACRFGTSAAVLVRYISANEVRCVVPPSVAPRSVDLFITFNGMHYEPLSIQFEYMSAWHIRTITPANGPIGGGTPVHIVLDSTSIRESVSCSFGDARVPARSIAANTIECTTPPFERVASVILGIRTTRSDDVLTRSVQPFEFVLPIQIQNAAPSVGVENTKAIVNVFGFNFLPSIQCRVNRTTLLGGAVYISSFHARCIIPATMATGMVGIDVTNNGVEFVSVSNVRFHPPLVAVELSPSNGPVTGGTPLRLHGSNLHLALLCRFGQILVPVQRIRANEIQCTTPPLPAGVVEVALSSNKRDFTPAAKHFVVRTVPQVLFVSPRQGQVDSLVRVTGTSFETPAWCRFNSALVEAQVLSSTVLLCMVPPLALPVVKGEMQTKATVEVSLNEGVDVSSNQVVFEYVVPFQLRRVAPLVGSENGGTAVHLYGLGFQQAKRYVCKFDTSAVLAVFVASSELVCKSPVHVPGTVALTLMDEQGNLFPTPFVFRYMTATIVHTATPSIASSAGGDTIWLHGLHFYFSHAMACHFDTTVVPAVHYNETVVSCVAPSHAAATVKLMWSPNGVDVDSATAVLFTFENAPVITAVSKASGVGALGDVIQVTGRNFSPDMECWIDGLETNATVVSSSVMNCTIPPLESRSTMGTIQIVRDTSMRSNVARIAYMLPARVRNVVPPFGGTRGTTSLRVLGQNFNRSLHLSCAFSDNTTVLYQTHATFVSPYELQCMSPSTSTPQALQVAIFQHDAAITEFTGSFRTVPIAQIYQVTPSEALHQGGKVIVVRGAHFMHSSALRCAFGGVFVPAAFINSTFLTCIAPEHVPGSVSFGVSNNNVDTDVAAGVQFTFLRPVFVHSISPTSGSVTGGTSIYVTGSGFGPTLTCWFDATAISAEVTGNSTAVCISPPAKKQYKSTSVSLGVSIDDLLPHVHITFTYTVNNRVERLVPSKAFTVGGTTLLIHMAQATPNVTCSFGTAPVIPATVVTPTQFSCVSPRAPSGFVNLTIRSGTDSIDVVPFEFVPSPTVVDVASPGTSSLTGGRDIEILGFHLEFVAECVIGSASVPAFVMENSVHCMSPPQQGPGSYVIVLSSPFGRVDTKRSVLYVADIPTSAVAGENDMNRPELLQVFPTVVETSGGVVLRVLGTGFQNTRRLVCQFGYERIAASFVSPTLITCVAPRHVPGTVVVEVASDGVTFSLSGTQVQVVHDVVVTSLSPSHGSRGGGTLVTVYGNHFRPDSAHLVCRFGPVRVVAAFLSPTSIQCKTPPQEDTAANAVLVHASNNNASFSSHGAFFLYASTPRITSVWPGTVTQLGGTAITVRGFHFTPRDVFCVWNLTQHTMAVVVTSTLLRCIAPRNVPVGVLALQLTTNRLDVSMGVNITVKANVILTKLVPSMGPALRGKTVVHIIGSGFENHVELACRFGTASVAAMFVNSTLIQCESPPHTVGTVPLQVTWNGLDEAVASLAFRFVADMEVRVIQPLQSLVTGQRPVFVKGLNFMNTSALGCRFGDVMSPATFVSSTLLVCIVPSRVGDVVDPVGLVSFEVTSNGVDYTASGVQFEYVRECPASRYCHGHDIALVPNGTAPSADSRNFSLCPPTTFQPRAGQQSCVPCPVGFYCPDFGMSKPVLCLAGFVCDRHGLRSPETMCPEGHYCLPGTKTTNVVDFHNRMDYGVDFETGIATFNVSSRPWNFIARVRPATGSRRLEHPPDILDPNCLTRQCVSNTSVLLPEKPFVCPLGTYCRSGAATPVTQLKNFSSPQPCFAGFFCPRGSATPEGKGPCPTGYYCPSTTDAIACPPGTYCPGVGNVKSTDCYPGSYQPASTQSTCELCPVGYICPGYKRTAPALCPAGFVCSSWGLSVPVVTCPSGFYCNEGTWTVDPSELTQLRPIPCSRGTFCLGGVKQNLIMDWLPAAPDGATAKQTCTEGTFCPLGTVASTLCYPGHYCPPGTEFPLQVPLGTFSQQEGSIAPTLCFPGTFSTFKASIECRVCPAGYSCEGYGVYIPEICPAGYYRSVADSVTCRLCPEGTWSPDTGLADISYCQPCPAGLNNLTQSIPCPSGYVCGEATTRERQYFHMCPGGYICGTETTHPKQFDRMCASGNVCYRGTKDTESTRFNCPQGSFCPAGTSDPGVKETQCPYGTSSLPVSNELDDCSILPVAICDKTPTDTSYYPVFTYTFQGTTYQYNSQTNIGRTPEIQVLKKILPVNLSASAAPWVNDTLDVIRSCPSIVLNDGGTLLTIVGRNFLPSNRLTCEFQLSDGKLVFMSVPATYVNSTRVTCRAPPFTFDGGSHEAEVVIYVTNFGVHRSTTGATILYTSAPIQLMMDCGYNADEEGPRPKGLGWFALRAFSQAFVSFDLRAIPADMVYDEHYKIALYVTPSVCHDEQCDGRGTLKPAGDDTETSPCRQPIVLPSWITSPDFEQRSVVNLTVMALEDMLIKPEIHLMYGLFLAAEDFFTNTTQVDITSPVRANVTQGIVADSRPLSSIVSFEERLVPREYTFVAIYRHEYSLVTPVPLNLPPRFDQFERGRVLIKANVSVDSNQPNLRDTPVPLPLNYWKLPYDTFDTTVKKIDKYRETFHGLNGARDKYSMDQVVLPYLPFFSHCFTYDSYIPIYDFLENQVECNLPGLEEFDRNWWRRKFPPMPNQDDIRIVEPTDVLEEPVADYCYRQVQCHYEEDLTTVDINPRWYEAKDLTHLFDILNEPITFAQYLQGGDLYNTLLAAANSDIFVPVLVDRTAAERYEGGCLLQCYPRSVTLELHYYQVTPQLKRLVSAKLILDEFDNNPAVTDYTLKLEFAPLNYIELVNAFAFDLNVFVVLFSCIGMLCTAIASVFWLITRLTTRIRDPPKLRYLSYLALIAPPPTIGIVLASVPCSVVVGAFYLLLNGDVFGEYKANKYPWSPWGADFWMIDNLKRHYMASQVDPTMVETIRHGRVGLCFFLMGVFLLCEGIMIFIPRTISISERAAEDKDDDDSLWKPTPWRRANVILTCAMVSVVMVLVIEFSFWSEFGANIFYTQISFEVIVPTLVMVVDACVSDVLLYAPIVCIVNVVFATVLIAAPDFLGFVIASFTAFGLVLVRRVYKKPTFFAVVHALNELVAGSKAMGKQAVAVTRFYLGQKPKQPPVGGDGKNLGNEELLPSVKPDDEGATVEPIIECCMEYTMATLAVFFQPIVIALLMVFRAETGLSTNWSIRNQDMEYYFFYFTLLIPFQLLADVFILHVIELFRGWKLYDYFVYCRYRFIQREHRWKGMEHNLDECIEQSVRHLDQMCFSSQYFFMCAVQVWGMLSLILAIEIMVRNQYNMFGDPAAIYLIPFMLSVCVFTRNTCMYVARKFALYKLRHENTAWHNAPDDDDSGVPDWEELERIKGASHEAFLMNQRLTSETFRFKFLNYNRPWIVAQLPNILTPRTLRRARPYLITQFSKILSSLNTNVSDDDDDDDGKPRFGPVSLNAPSRDLIRLWLAKARRRLRLRLAVQPLINAARKVECESCLSRRQLQVEMVIPIEVMGDKFERSYPSDEFDVAEWKKYFAQHQKFKTLCLSCLAKQKLEMRMPALGANADNADDDMAAATLGFGQVHLNAASRALMLKWYRLGQDRVFGKTGKRRAVADVSDDEDDIATRGAAWANRPVRLNAASTAIALKWMVSARLNLKAKVQGKKVTPLEASVKPKRKKPPTKESMKAQRTKRK